MAKNSKGAGPSDVNQPGEPLHLQNAEVVPGSRPDSANVATTRVVEEADLSDEERERRTEKRREEKQARREERYGGVDEEQELSGTEREIQKEFEEDGDSTTSPLSPGVDPDEDEIDDPDEEDEAEADGASVTATAPAYEPADHTVAEVNAYLHERSEAGDDQEVDRVLRAEVAGRNRTGIVAGS